MSIIPQSSLCRLFQESSKCRRLTEAKLHTFPVIQHYAVSDSEKYNKYAENILNCSNDLSIRVFSQIQEQGVIAQTSIEGARWCRCRQCPMCQFARSSKMRAKLFKAFTNYDFDGKSYSFLTLTIRNRPLDELRASLKEMTVAWDRLTKRRTFPILGYLRSMEVTMQRHRLPGDKKKNTGPPTRSPTGQLMAHPHFHILLQTHEGFDKYSKNKFTLIDEWQSALCVDYRPSICLDRVRSTNDDFAKALLETAKYTVKPGDFVDDVRDRNSSKPKRTSSTEVLPTVVPHGAEWLYGITEQLHGLRAVRLGGTFAKICSQKELDRIDDSCEADNSESQLGNLLKLSWNDLKSSWNISDVSSCSLGE